MKEYTIDAKGKRFGRLASEIAIILQGKKSPTYNPRLPGGEKVVVKNIKEISISGNKESAKVYYRHTGYMGHLKERSFKEAFERDPERVLREAVRHMLPKNKLSPRRLKNIIFA